MGGATDASFGVAALFSFALQTFCRSVFAVRACRLQPLVILPIFFGVAILGSVSLQLYLVVQTFRAVVNDRTYIVTAQELKRELAAECYVAVAVDMVTCASICARLFAERGLVTKPIQSIVVRLITYSFSTAYAALSAR